MRPWIGLFALALAAAPAAHAATDCALAPGLPTYEAGSPPDGRSYNAVDLLVERAGTIETFRVAGQTCLQHYAPMDGTDPLSDRQIQDEYRDRLREAGAEIVYATPQATIARRTAGGEETWVRVTSQETAIDVTTIKVRPRAQVLSAPGPTDYRLLGHMPDYAPESSDRRAFDQRGFMVKDGDETRETIVQGARIEVDYSLRDGGRPASDLDIQENYRTALAALGATILFTDERNTVARLDTPGQSIWIRVWSQETAINITVIEQASHRQTLLPPTPPDHRLLGHMPGYVADPPEKHALEEVIFPLPAGEDTREIKVQGARTDIAYAPAPGAALASDLDIQLNYRNALAAIGAQILFTDAATTIARLDDNGRVLWAKIWSQETAINLTLVDEKGFKSAVKPISAETLKAALDARGRAGLYLPFLFNRPTPRPDATPMIAELARLLRENPKLRLTIEAHTDNIAPRAESLSLATSRATALRDALAQTGIDPTRLTPIGIGPDRPLADNTTSEGRARNRRVVIIRE